MDERGEDLEDQLLEFASRVGKLVDAIPDTRLGRHVTGQLVRSGTSPTPNYADACAVESNKDFVHKLGIALTESSVRVPKCDAPWSNRKRNRARTRRSKRPLAHRRSRLLLVRTEVMRPQRIR